MSFIKGNVRQGNNTNKVQERRLNVRYITDYWQATEAGVVLVSHDGNTLYVEIDIDTLDAMLIG